MRSLLTIVFLLLCGDAFAQNLTFSRIDLIKHLSNDGIKDGNIIVGRLTYQLRIFENIETIADLLSVSNNRQALDVSSLGSINLRTLEGESRIYTIRNLLKYFSPSTKIKITRDQLQFKNIKEVDEKSTTIIFNNPQNIDLFKVRSNINPAGNVPYAVSFPRISFDLIDLQIHPIIAEWQNKPLGDEFEDIIVKLIYGIPVKRGWLPTINEDLISNELVNLWIQKSNIIPTISPEKGTMLLKNKDVIFTHKSIDYKKYDEVSHVIQLDTDTSIVYNLKVKGVPKSRVVNFTHDSKPVNINSIAVKRKNEQIKEAGTQYNFFSNNFKDTLLTLEFGPGFRPRKHNITRGTGSINFTRIKQNNSNTHWLVNLSGDILSWHEMDINSTIRVGRLFNNFRASLEYTLTTKQSLQDFRHTISPRIYFKIPILLILKSELYLGSFYSRTYESRKNRQVIVTQNMDQVQISEDKAGCSILLIFPTGSWRPFFHADYALYQEKLSLVKTNRSTFSIGIEKQF